MTRVALVGAGPGDPGLLTLKAADLLSRADVVLVDRLVDPGMLQHVREGAEVSTSARPRGPVPRRGRRRSTRSSSPTPSRASGWSG